MGSLSSIVALNFGNVKQMNSATKTMCQVIKRTVQQYCEINEQKQQLLRNGFVFFANTAGDGKGLNTRRINKYIFSVSCSFQHTVQLALRATTCDKLRPCQP